MDKVGVSGVNNQMNSTEKKTHLAGFEEVKADVGITRGGIHAVLTEVLVDVFRRGLGQETIYALPKGKRRYDIYSTSLWGLIDGWKIQGKVRATDEEDVNSVIKKPHSIHF